MSLESNLALVNASMPPRNATLLPKMNATTKFVIKIEVCNSIRLSRECCINNACGCANLWYLYYRNGLKRLNNKCLTIKFIHKTFRTHHTQAWMETILFQIHFKYDKINFYKSYSVSKRYFAIHNGETYLVTVKWHIWCLLLLWLLQFVLQDSFCNNFWYFTSFISVIRQICWLQN